MSPPPVDSGPTVSAHFYERIVATVIAVWVVVLISYLILSDRDFDPARIYFLKILLALSCGIVVGTLPGFLNLNLNAPGLVVRAAGGAAAFVFVYTQSPSVPELGLAPPNIKLNELRGIDFRSLRGPGTDELATSPIAITVPIEVRNERQPSSTGSLRRTDVRFSLSGQDYRYRPYYFVRMAPGPAGTWLSSEDKIRLARPVDLPPGFQFFEEVMHLSDAPLSWRDFIASFKSAAEEFIVHVDVTLSTGLVPLACRISTGKYKRAIEQLEAKLGRLPGYISVECEA